MSKYTEEQLTAMAKSLTGHRKTNDPNSYMHTIMVLSMFTGLTQDQIEGKLQKMAEGDFSDIN